MSGTLYINGRFLAQPLSGVQRFATEMTRALLQTRDDVTVLVPRGVSDLGDLVAHRAAIRKVGRHSGQLWEQVELPRHVSDGLLINLGNTGPMRVRRQVVVVHDCGVFRTPEAYSWKFRAWYQVMQRWLIHSGAQIVTVSEFSRREIAECFGVSPEQIAVIPEGGDHMQRIVPEPEILERNGLEPGRFVLAVGNLSTHKNLVALGELAVALVARGMVLAVTGGLDVGIFQSSPGSTLPNPARYLGRVSDGALRSLYEAAACFVFPSRYEGFGLPALEAMACGCPVVASDIPALREVCADTAVYCDPDSPENIAASVEQQLSTQELPTRQTVRVSDPVQQYTWERAAKAMVDVSNFQGHAIERMPSTSNGDHSVQTLTFDSVTQ
jgi:glycosyltransferase involved in cell wall biosynthesis